MSILLIDSFMSAIKIDEVNLNQIFTIAIDYQVTLKTSKAIL